jgi:hypothetical protein
MSLIVTRIIGDEIRVVSNTKITNYSAIHETPLDGLLKCVVVSPTCCVCFAGNVGLAQATLRPILDSDNLDGVYVTEHLLLEHRAGNSETDFIVALTDPQPTVYRIVAGKIEAASPSTWIGDQAAFATDQAHYHTLESKPFSGFAVDELRRFEAATRMSDAFHAVIDDQRHHSVNDFSITITSKPAEGDGFRYLASSVGFGFHSISNTTEETSLFRPLGAAGGSYNYSVLTPRHSGVGAVAVHFLEGKLGALFYPRIQWAPVLFRDTAIDEFIDAVSQQFGVPIDGIRHS